MNAVFHSRAGSISEFAFSSGNFFPCLPVNIAFHVIFKGKTVQIFFYKGNCRATDSRSYRENSPPNKTVFPKASQFQRSQKQTFHLKKPVGCHCFSISKFIIVCKNNKRMATFLRSCQHILRVVYIIPVILMSEGYKRCCCTAVGKIPVSGQTFFTIVYINRYSILLANSIYIWIRCRSRNQNSGSDLGSV